MLRMCGQTKNNVPKWPLTELNDTNIAFFFIFVGLNMTEVQMTLAHQLGQRMAAAHASEPISPICQKSTKAPTYLRPPQPKSFRSWIQKLRIWTIGN